MSQQKQQSQGVPDAPKCSPPQCPNLYIAPCSVPCGAPISGGCGFCSQKHQAQSLSCPRRVRRQKPSCISGGTVHYCKEEEC
ncbi:late cornified envelope protein 6A [Cavia porcellus]|uniref:late cornified envelope protein 6A n=1 Tax=Cavia porcellus TaxID=10141 RepID=UPI000350985F|nr:late cornified envelope protein 6A [Cavia porcellus]